MGTYALYIVYALIFMSVLLIVEGVYFFISTTTNDERIANKRMKLIKKTGDDKDPAAKGYDTARCHPAFETQGLPPRCTAQAARISSQTKGQTLLGSPGAYLSYRSYPQRD